MPGDGMLHPAALASLALLVLNDHVLKRAYPGLVTGKLSDVAGLVFFPLLLVALVEVLARVRGRFTAPSVRVLLVAVVATGVVFALSKTWPPAADLYRTCIAALQWPYFAARALLAGRALPGLGRVLHVMDPTDLVALPALLVAFWVGRMRCPSRAHVTA
jgi:hypothetical protein